MSKNIRGVIKVLDSTAVMDGDGVRIQRCIAHQAMDSLDPFLLLDEFASDEAADYIGGFPEHPHRGFETVTYMLEGSMLHRDHMGNEGHLTSGGVQWMTAGRGVIHSEMPEQEDGRLHGFQLWVNLPAKDKMRDANYREFNAADIPVVALNDGGIAKVIAGKFMHGENAVAGPVQGVSTQADYFDILLGAGETLELPLAANKRVLLYVYAGVMSVGHPGERQVLRQGQLAMLGEGEQVEIYSDDDCRFLVLAGIAIKEPVANWGPFVMNTQAEIDQAIRDYRAGSLV